MTDLLRYGETAFAVALTTGFLLVMLDARRLKQAVTTLLVGGLAFLLAVVWS